MRRKRRPAPIWGQLPGTGRYETPRLPLVSAPAPRRPPGVYVGRPFGIPVYFDVTWILLAAYITYSYAPTFSRNGETPGARSYSLAFVVALLFAVSVLLHELAHSIIAIRDGPAGTPGDDPVLRRRVRDQP